MHSGAKHNGYRAPSDCYRDPATRVESGSDDPDNLGHLSHFFGGSSGCHPQTKLSGYNPDITCSLKTVLASAAGS